VSRARIALWLLAAAACGSRASAPSQNVAEPARPRVTISPDQALGWIGVAPLPARDVGNWIPAGPQAALVVMPAEGIAAGAALSAIDTAGRIARVTAAGPAKVPYGCDNQQLDVLALTGPRLAPGPVWLLPPAAPASWAPKRLVIVSPAEPATEASRRDTAGPLSLSLSRIDDTHGTLAIARDGRVLHTLAFERGAMESAEPSPLDFRELGIAIPVPAAAWSIAEGGPILLVLLVPSFEGTSLKPILVQEGGTRELPEMESYLYQCAF
jgi:hypothetical protein